jgi:putative transposase
MGKRRIIDDKLYAHFLTFNVYHRRRLLDLDQPKRIVLGVLNKQLLDFKAKCVGFVIMPEHVHAIVWFPEIKQLSNFMHEWKRVSSINIRDWYRTHSPNYFEGFGEGDEFWHPKYHAFEIYSREKMEEKLECMHMNPVNRGLVKNIVEWPRSSARWYVSGQSVGVPIEWVQC